MTDTTCVPPIDACGLEDTTTTRIIFLAVITGLQALVNHMGIGLTAKLTDFSGYLIFATSILLAIVCLATADSYDIGRLFTFSNYSGETGGNVWPTTSTTWVFLLGLLLPIYTITGYDASAHTSEETIKAAHSVPRRNVAMKPTHRMAATSCPSVVWKTRPLPY